MKFKTKVKYNGKYYAAGEDVPMEGPKTEARENSAEDEKVKPVKAKK